MSTSKIFLISIFLCGAAWAEIPEPGHSEKIFLDEKAGGFKRSFRLHVPAGAKSTDADQPRPLVLALHGGFATARILEKQSGLSEVADREGFLVAYPNGFGFFSLARHWNGGVCCGKALKSNFDELGFLDRVTEWIAERYPVDPERIYVIGYSNGGMLAHWYASERADKLAGLGIWASSIGSVEKPDRSWTWPTPKDKMPVFIAHGKSDNRLPYDTLGLAGPAAERKNIRLLGGVGSARAWAEANGCTEDPRGSTAGAVERREWCTGSDQPVVFVGLDGWGHDWPGPNLTAKLPSSEPLRNYHLAEEMWAFFSRAESTTSADRAHRSVPDATYE